MPQDELAQYAAKTGSSAPPPSLDDLAQYATKKESPGFLDKEIPLAGSWYNPTLSGAQSIGRGVRGAAQGLYQTILHPIDTATATAHSVAEIPSTLAQIPGAIHDINASPDPLTHYAKAAQETAGQGAGQAILALGTEGLVKGAPIAARAIKPVVAGAARVASDVIDPDLVGIAAPRLAHAQRLAGRIADALEKKPGTILDATSENKPFAGGADEPPPQKILDATGENKPFAGGMDEAAPQAILPAEPPMLQAQPAPATAAPQSFVRIAPDLANWQPPPELGVTSAPDYGAAARADVERRMGGALPRGMAERRIITPIEETPDVKDVPREEWNDSRFIEPQIEGTPRGDLTKQLQESLDQVNARKKPPQSVGGTAKKSSAQ